MTLQGVDFFALAPLFILLIAALSLLLLETFADKRANQWAFPVTMLALMFALFAVVIAPQSENPLLTPWLRFDELSRFFSLFFLSVGLVTTLLANSFFQRFYATHSEYYFLQLSALFGLMLIGAAADFLTLFLGLETLSLALYVLCTYMKKWDFSGEAALKYFIMGSIAAAFLLYGIALIYGAVGTTQLNGLLNAYHQMTNPATHALFLGGIALITLGLAFKAALVPFHVWAPDVYDGAPNPVTAFMAVGTKGGAFAAFARLFLVALPGFDPLWNQGVAWLAMASMIYANIVALRQMQLRRLFAYSGISHAGFLLIPIVAGTPEALPALEFYLVVYALATLGVFVVLAALDDRPEGVLFKDLQGLFYRSPYLAGAFALCLLTLAGIPPTAGFFAKFYVFKVAFHAGDYSLVIVGLLTTILSVFYYMRLLSLLFSEASPEAPAPRSLWSTAFVSVSIVFTLAAFSLFPDTLFALLYK